MIQLLRLANFKNFCEATLSLGKLTILVGTNASGKSNLRDAFRFIHGMARGYNLAEIIGEKYIEGGALQWKGIRGGLREVAYENVGEFTLSTEFWVERRVYAHSITVAVENNGDPPRITKESLYERSGGLFDGRKIVVYDSHPDKDPPKQEDRPHLFVRLPRGDTHRRRGARLGFLDTQPVLTQVPRQRKAPASLRKKTERVLGDLSSMRFLDLSPEAMRIPSLPGQTVLGDRGENLSSVLQTICASAEKKRAILEWIRQLTPLDVEDFAFFRDQTGKVLVTLIETGGRQTSAYSASDGTLRFLAMIAAMLGPDPARFYFFEELDTGIHPTRLHLLLQLIEQTVAQKNVQVVATTHSPQLLGFLGPDAREAATLVYRLPHHGEARLRRILEIPEAKRILAKRNLSRLHESGWLENAVNFLEAEPDSQEA